MTPLSAPGIEFRTIAVLVENGVHHASFARILDVLNNTGAIVRVVGPRKGVFVGDSGDRVEAVGSMESSPAVLFDALVLPDGRAAIQALAINTHAVEYVKGVFAQCKSILALGAGRGLLEAAGVGSGEHAGVVLGESVDTDRSASVFIRAVAANRHFSRNVNP